jgi:hypothetical protein
MDVNVPCCCIIANLPPVSLPVSIPVSLPACHLSACLSPYLPPYLLGICVPVCLSVSLPVFLPACNLCSCLPACLSYSLPPAYIGLFVNLLLRQVFIRVYRLEIPSAILVFSTQLCELLPF